MDNFQVIVTGYLKRQFEAAMQLAFEGGFGLNETKVTHYSVTEKGLTLYWSGTNGVEKLPYPMGCIAATNFVWGWLQEAGYGEPDDFDGSVKKGFTVSRKQYERDYVTVIVKPEWAEFHK